MSYFEIVPIEISVIIAKLLTFPDIKNLSKAKVIPSKNLYKSILTYGYPKLIKGGIEFCKLTDVNKGTHKYILSCVHNYSKVGTSWKHPSDTLIIYLSYDVYKMSTNYRLWISQELLHVDILPQVTIRRGRPEEGDFTIYKQIYHHIILVYKLISMAPDDIFDPNLFIDMITLCRYSPPHDKPMKICSKILSIVLDKVYPTNKNLLFYAICHNYVSYIKRKKAFLNADVDYSYIIKCTDMFNEGKEQIMLFNLVLDSSLNLLRSFHDKFTFRYLQ